MFTASDLRTEIFKATLDDGAVDTENWPECHLSWFENRMLHGMRPDLNDVLTLIATIRKERAKLAQLQTITDRSEA
jgi:hypothetical protein